ncbi:MAG: LytTR family DNA-binding domain-containing protein [Bacteroidota bacterium]
MSASPLSYPDRWLRIIAIPSLALFVQLIGLDWETIKDYVGRDYFYINFLFNTFNAFVMWHIARAVIIYMDRKMPYEKGFSKRVLVQIFSSILLSVSIGELLTFIYIKIIFRSTYWDNHWNTDIPVAILLIVLLNLVYIGFYLFQRPSVEVTASQNDYPSPEIAKTEIPIEVKPLAMISRNKTVLVALEEVVLIASQDRLSFAYLKDGQKLLVEKTIKQLVEELPEADFFQANRAQIIQRQFVASHQKTSTRKLLISLNNLTHYEGEITVSKARSPLFLSWLSA